MKRIFVLKIFIVTLFVFSFCAFGQSNAEIERELVGHIKNIKKFSSYTNGSVENRDEKLTKENSIFKEKLLKYTKEISTLKYKFSELDKYLYIATSADGKLRAYSWDTETGGSMHFFDYVYQFESKKGLVDSTGANLEEGNPAGFISDIFYFDRDVDFPKKRFYIVRSTSILSNSLAVEKIECFGIADVILHRRERPVKPTGGGSSVVNWKRNVRLFEAVLFETENEEEFTNSLSIQYDFFSVVDRKERPIKLISLNKSTKTLRVPVIIEDNKFPNGKVTKRFTTYKFNGDYFKKVKR